MVLSISILVSGREKTTKQCIASLDRLRRKVSCELILVDTGCSEEMRQWLEVQADKVISFQWCNDFAAARNVGLAAASGEWFMFLDDDEWFENTCQLEKFFLSGEYKRFASASYIIRNYTDMEGKQWQDVPLPRMARKDDGIGFIYPIHEMLWPRYEPVKQLEDYVHHFGYASADAQAQKAKHQRNLSILLPAIEEEPHCMHHYLQAAMEYIAIEDFDCALKMSEDGIAHYDSNRKDNDQYFNGLCAGAVKARVLKKDYEEACKRGEELLELASLSRLGKASIYGDLAIAWSAGMGQDRQSHGDGQRTDAVQREVCAQGGCIGTEAFVKYLQKYLEEKHYFSGHSMEALEQQTLILDSCFTVYHYQMVMGWGFAAMLYSGQVKETELLLQRETLEWWMEAVQNWYTCAGEQDRERWKEDFHRLVSVRQEQCAFSRQLYHMLTAPENGGEENAESGRQGKAEQPAAGGQDAGTEMEVLAAKLKVQIRFLMEQHQNEAALAAVRQVLQFLPNDRELLELLDKLEGR